MTVLLWSSLAILAYVYLGYPVLLWLTVRVRGPRRVRKAPAEPSVSLVISAYNEAAVMTQRLQNALKTDYPPEQLEIVVVSDGSTDGTDALVQLFGPRVRLYRQEPRRGKTAGLNGVLPTLRGEIVVFSDANAMYAPDAIRNLVCNFSDPVVGCVTGESRYVGASSAAAVSESAYWSYEMGLKRLETDVGSMVGGDGAIYAIRRSLWKELPETAINDFLNPLQIVAAGWRCVYEPTAVCFEAPAASVAREWHRRVRIVSRSWRAVFQAAQVLNPLKVGFFSVAVVSHKMLRWLAGIFMLLAGVSLLVQLTLVPDPLIGVLAVSALGLAFVGALAMRLSLATSLAYFVTLQMAALLGVALGSVGRVSATWAPPREAETSR